MRPVLVVCETHLPEGFLGLTDLSDSACGRIYVDERQGRRKYLQTFLHEIAHFLLGHAGPPSQEVEDAVEELAVRMADELLAIEAA